MSARGVLRVVKLVIWDFEPLRVWLLLVLCYVAVGLVVQSLARRDERIYQLGYAHGYEQGLQRRRLLGHPWRHWGD